MQNLIRIAQAKRPGREREALAPLAEAEGIINAAATASQAAAAAESELAAAQAAVALSLEVPEHSDLVQIVTERLAEVAAALAPLLGAEAAGAPSVTAARASVTTIQAELGALRNQLNTVEERHSALGAAILGIDERLATFSTPVPTVAELTH